MAGGYQDDEFNPMKLNPLALGLQAGSGLIGQVGSWLGGGQDRKDQKWGRSRLQSMYGKDVLNPAQITGQKKLSYMSSLRDVAGGANKRLGLNSGQAWQEMMWKYGNMEGDDLADLMAKNAMLKAQRDAQIAQALYGAGR